MNENTEAVQKHTVKAVRAGAPATPKSSHSYSVWFLTALLQTALGVLL